MSYAELSHLSDALLQNIPSRCLVFNLSSNCLGALVGYVACLQGRKVTLMLDDHIDNDLISHFILTYKPDYLLIATLKYMNIIENFICNDFKNEKIKIIPLVKAPIFKLLKEIWCN